LDCGLAGQRGVLNLPQDLRAIPLTRRKAKDLVARLVDDLAGVPLPAVVKEFEHARPHIDADEDALYDKFFGGDFLALADDVEVLDYLLARQLRPYKTATCRRDVNGQAG